MDSLRQVLPLARAADTAAEELAHARAHFFLPHRLRDPFHTAQVPTESVTTDDRYALILEKSRDALGNTVTVGERNASGTIILSGQDYRVLKPRLVTDPNGNRTAVSFDALGMVVGTAVMGKRDETPRKGDLLDGFIADLPEPTVLEHLANPLNNPHSILSRATARILYDIFAFLRTKHLPEPQPVLSCSIARETHDADLAPGERTKIQHAFSYSDGFGRDIQSKVQAEPGRVGDSGPVVSPRWASSGWAVFDNKGNTVRQFEPYFSATHHFEFDLRVGASATLIYDPVKRLVATLYPNHAWTKTIRDSWRQESWDTNDTALIENPATDPDVGEFFRRMPDSDYLPTWIMQRDAGAMGPDEQAAARKTRIHAGTPSVSHVDSLGRSILTFETNRFERNGTLIEERHEARASFDIEGNQLEAIDAKGRAVIRSDYNVVGTRIYQASMEAGERWTLSDVAGNSIFAWDSRNNTRRATYDALRRPSEGFLIDSANVVRIVARNISTERADRMPKREIREAGL